MERVWSFLLHLSDRLGYIGFYGENSVASFFSFSKRKSTNNIFVLIRPVLSGFGLWLLQ